jgi:hypothetical protein
MQRISRDLPLSEITLRRYEKPTELQGRELVRKLCLSLGLLQPGDSRDVIVDILTILLQAKTKKEELNSDQIRMQVIDSRKQHNLPVLGIAQSNIRRQLKRLKDLMLIETNSNNYRISEFLPLTEVFKEKGESFLLNAIMQRVKEYLKKIDEEFS